MTTTQPDLAPLALAVDPRDLGDRAWVVSAACLGADPDMFFAPEADVDAHLAAASYCSSCPVQADCLDYALETNQRHGTWGNTTARQRRSIARQRAA